jgi:hypothetical protein
MENIWKKDYDYINVAVKFFGIYFEFWQEIPKPNEEKSKFLDRIKNEFKIKYPNRDIQFTFVYKPYIYTIHNKRW